MTPAIVLMSKVPRAGYTKTRLMSHLTGEECAEFHTACLTDLARTLEQTGLAAFLYYTGDKIEKLSNKESLKKLNKRPQSGADLGERLYNAALEVLKQHAGLIFIGADLPYLGQSAFFKAAEQLSVYDTVIGPTEDGGYYLLGLKHAYPELFTNIKWGSAQVLNTTLNRIKTLGLSVSLLELERDIDTWADALDFYRKHPMPIQHQELESYLYLDKIISKGTLGTFCPEN